MMTFLRQYIAPLFALLLFLIALFVVSVRIFLPTDMMAPAPLQETPISAVPKSEPYTLATYQFLTACQPPSPSSLNS